MGRKMTPVDIGKLIEVYQATKSLTKTAERMGIGISIVCDRLKKNNISLSKVGGQHKYTCIDDFFSFNTPEVFYWAGFLAADGCVTHSYHNGYAVQLVLSAKDIKHIYKFKNGINYSGHIDARTIKEGVLGAGNKMVGMTVHSQKMFDDLARFNIVPNKTLTYSFPTWLLFHSFANHFIRGYTDGDGCWSIDGARNGRHYNVLRYHICGTQDLVESIRYLYGINCSTNINKSIYKVGNIYNVSFIGNTQTRSIRNFLYKGANETIWLDRKYAIAYNNWIDIIPEHNQQAVKCVNLNTGEEKYFISMKEAERYGFNHTGISECCRNIRKTYKGCVFTYLI